jgi:hypothetical protein
MRYLFPYRSDVPTDGKPRGDMEYELRCMVYPGQFSNEHAVEGMQANGE